MLEVIACDDLVITPIAQVDARFSKSGVYFLYRDAMVVYVGESCNVLRRVGEHISDRKKTFDSVAMVDCSTDSRLWLEQLCIKKFKPLYNLNPKADRALRPRRVGRSRKRVYPEGWVRDARPAA